MILPNYQSGSVVNLVSTIMEHCGVQYLYQPLADFTLPKHKRLVFIVVDGMGLSFLETHGKHSTLYRNLHTSMTSVFPSTTSAALTSLMTGVAPLQHGLTGWFMYFRELATAGVPLSFSPRFTEKPFAELDVKINDILDFETVFDKLNKSIRLIIPQATINSPFSNYCYGATNKTGFETIDQCFEAITHEITHHQQTEMIYAYIPHFDEISHLKGINSAEAIDCFQKIDSLFTNLILKSNDTETLYIVTADHGLVDTPKDRVLNIADYPDVKNCLILPLSGEPRVPYCYIRPAKYDYFKKAVDEQLGEYCDRYSLAELMERNAYGLGTPNPKVFDRIGDEILVMRENYVLIERVYHEKQKEFVGFHGGLHRDEMLVPLIVNG